MVVSLFKTPVADGAPVTEAGFELSVSTVLPPFLAMNSV